MEADMYLIEVDSGQQVTIYKVRDQQQAANHIVKHAADDDDITDIAEELVEGGFYTDDDFTCWYICDELKEDVDLTGEA
jgi:hypothetical protein